MLVKLLILIAVIVAVWKGFGLLRRLSDARAAPPPGRTRSRDDDRAPVAELTQCRVCGTYVSPRDGVSCEREGCPHARRGR